MPGIAGYISQEDGSDGLRKARQRMAYGAYYLTSDFWKDGSFACTHTSLGHTDRNRYPVATEEIFAWIDGEAYQLEAVGKRFGISSNSLADLLCQAWQLDRLEAVLAHIDGVFSAVLYDRKQQRICLITDRFGSRPLYFFQQNSAMAWSSELKGMPDLLPIKPGINPLAVQCMMQCGHLLGDQTWFEGVRLLPPSTIISAHIGEVPSEKRYWTWNAVPLQTGTLNQAAHETARLLQRAVRKCLTPGLKTGLLLSGGIDSRVILAALPPEADIVLFTFGDPRSDDVRIAQLIAGRVPWRHYILPLTPEKWWETRPRATWQTDGMVNALHLHNTLHHDFIRLHCDIVLNGHSINLGGYALGKKDRRADAPFARKLFGAMEKWSGWEDPWFDLPRRAPFFLESVIRHKSLYGGINLSKAVEVRRPFLDNDLISFVYGLPSRYVSDYRLYIRAANLLSPALFRDIPWQKTGFPIRYSALTRWYLRLRIKEIRRRLHLRHDTFPIADYASWIRQPDAAAYFTALLDPTSALYPTYTDDRFLHALLLPHLQGKGDHIERIGRAATIAWWLQGLRESGY